MSRPAAGRYFIYNRVLSPSGQKLAITFKKDAEGAVVTGLNFAPSQIWDVKDFDDKTQSISPDGDNKLQAAWGDGFISVKPAGNFVWVVRSSDQGFTIKDGRETNNWGLDNAVEGHLVNIGKPKDVPEQHWVFEKV